MIAVRNIVDLSHNLNNDTPVYPGDPEPDITIATTIEKQGDNLFNLILGTQTGSHVDAPYHFLNDGQTIDAISLNLCMGRAFVIDVNSKKSNEKIRVEDIEPYRSQIESVQVVLFRTDWHKKAGTEEFMNHPHLSENSGHYLQKFGIQTVGIDAQLILMQPVEISFLFMTCMLL